ncbi:FAD-dependent oxidoreductase [Brachybacterium muris]|uniref:FAD-dependent oxidoreductase n=1 Tax=Brachybacterium muris TaxID=219301 RepID=UPI003B8A8220
MREADVVVIGAGQAGLSAAYHLWRRGFRSTESSESSDRADSTYISESSDRTVILLDAEQGPGGAWRHRWDSLTMATVNGIRELPGTPEVESDPSEPSNQAVPAYFADFEARYQVPIERSVRVVRVENDPDAPDDPEGPLPRRRLLIHSVGPDDTSLPLIRTRAILNATGTWTRPFLPAYPGAADFTGRQLHTADYTRAGDFTGKRVAVIGGGISALGHLMELADAGATTHWYTRREPVFTEEAFTAERGSRAVAGVAERVAQGLPVQSVVSATGLFWTPTLREADRRGILERHPMFGRIVPGGVIEADGTTTELDVLLWATGFRHELTHLRPLRLHNHRGGITMDGTAVAEDPRIHLLGYGPSASTIGANRAGRAAVAELVRLLEAGDEVEAADEDRSISARTVA